MRLLVIRHGESEADILNVHEGRADFNLTERGRAQAKAMSEWVAARYRVERLYASPLKRARQTADMLSQATGVPIEESDLLMEFNNGKIAGLDRKTAKEKYPQVLNLAMHQSVYDQESALEFRYRADYILSRILSENPDNATVAMVTHGGMINQLYRSLLRLPVDCDLYWNTSDTGVHEWAVGKTYRRIVFSNSTRHADM